MTVNGLPKACERSFAMVTRITVTVLTIMIGALCGCGAVPQSKYYQLSAPREASFLATADPLPITLLVGPLKSSHLYREDRLVYATGGVEMGAYEGRRWVQPPTEMMQELLWRTLRASGRFSGVSRLSSNSHGDFLVQGNLYDFKEISGNSLVARLSLDLELRELKTGAIVWTHSYAHDEPVNGKDVPAVVVALDQNAQRGMSEAVTSLNEYFASHPKK